MYQGRTKKSKTAKEASSEETTIARWTESRLYEKILPGARRGSAKLIRFCVIQTTAFFLPRSTSAEESRLVATIDLPATVRVPAGVHASLRVIFVRPDPLLEPSGVEPGPKSALLRFR